MAPLFFLLAAAAAAALIVRSNTSADAPAAQDAPAPEPDTGAGADLASTADTLAPVATNELGFSMPAVNTWKPPKAAAPYLDTIAAAETANNLPAGLLARLLYQESRYRDDIITGATKSPAGAVGIAQFMPATARQMGVDPLDPTSAIDGAARYLRQLFDQTGSWANALASYNWGIGNVKRKGLGKAPAETRAYVAQISADVGLG